MAKKILLLGSGELGKEFVIAAQRKGQYVIACDSYAGAPAMQVADECEVFSMLDGDALEAAVAKHQPDIIVPEIEAIRTEKLYDFEAKGIQVVPSAKAVNYTMNRKAIRDLAAKELGLKTAKYFYAKSLEELKEAANEIGFPCVVKPLMSSSGKGQSLVKSADELEQAWIYGCEGSRGDIKELIIEEFIKFDSEITLLTVTQQNGPTLFCAPIGEELLMRCLVHDTLKKYQSPQRANVSQGILFGLLHGASLQTIYTALIGLFMGNEVQKNKNLTCSLMIHFGFNLGAGLNCIFPILGDFIGYNIGILVVSFCGFIFFTNIVIQNRKAKNSNS